ncbi:MAG TPA: ribonuclease H-like domain-containing protein, partial [Polyangiaceae bacterium]|nr:ribonuclease H-like domain-containing protein [Polyangiaceae bacterium]
MLKNTFIHADGVGPVTEKKLWSAGVHTWDHFIARQRENNLPSRSMKRLTPLIEDSQVAFRRHDVGFFGARLKPSDQWRLYREFSGQAAFVDIETTGLSPDFDQITVVGLFAGGSFQSFVQGKNLDLFPAAIAGFPLVVTFNGAQFDLPFLKKRFPELNPAAHIDLRYPLAKLGHKGGLKQIERKLGIVRPDHLREVDGYEAVRLWSEHRRGRTGALNR